MRSQNPRWKIENNRSILKIRSKNPGKGDIEINFANEKERHQLVAALRKITGEKLNESIGTDSGAFVQKVQRDGQIQFAIGLKRATLLNGNEVLALANDLS